MVHTVAVMRETAGNPDLAEGVSGFVDNRPATFAGLDASFRVPGDLGC